MDKTTKEVINTLFLIMLERIEQVEERLDKIETVIKVPDNKDK